MCVEEGKREMTKLWENNITWPCKYDVAGSTEMKPPSSSPLAMGLGPTSPKNH